MARKHLKPFGRNNIYIPSTHTCIHTHRDDFVFTQIICPFPSIHTRVSYMCRSTRPRRRRRIAGTAEEEGETANQWKKKKRRTAEKPRASRYALASLRVQLLEVVMETLRDKSQQQMQRGYTHVLQHRIIGRSGAIFKMVACKDIENKMRIMDFFNYVHNVTA